MDKKEYYKKYYELNKEKIKTQIKDNMSKPENKERIHAYQTLSLLNTGKKTKIRQSTLDKYGIVKEGDKWISTKYGGNNDIIDVTRLNKN
jgi:hypothetical protein